MSGGAAILRMPRLMCCVRKPGKISVGGSRCCSLLLLSQHFFVALVATEWLASFIGVVASAFMCHQKQVSGAFALLRITVLLPVSKTAALLLLAGC